MQSLVLPPSSFIATEFGQPRFDPVPDRLPLSLSRSANARRCTPRDLPLPRSMSDSVPAEDPLETSANVRRLGHPELPYPVTTVATSSASSAAATISAGGASGSFLASGLPAATTTVHGSPLHRVASAPGDDLSRHAFAVADTFSASRLPPSLGGQVPPSSQPAAPIYSQPTFGPSSSPGTGARGITQKPTRRTKAHVASACVNCKKKHLGCDPARPCRRCVLSGKEATCVDVTHKKRGRPPLKAEEASLRSYSSQVDSGATSGGLHGHRRAMHRATSSREIRPVTDLQIPGGPHGAMGRAAVMPQHRWPPSVYPSNLDPALTMQRNIGHRRFSSSGSVQSIMSSSPPGFVPMPPGAYNHGLGAGRIPVGVGRPLSSYGNQAFHAAASPPQYQQAFGAPISPYTDSARMANRMPMGDPSMRDPRESYLESPVRLPPIYPPTMASPSSGPQSHRMSDPYSTGWSPRARDEGFSEQRQQHMPGHGFLDPISPTSQMRQAMSEVSYGETVPRVLSTVDPAVQRQSLQLSSARVRDEEPTGEAEAGDSRPAKRRKMALDDMVNG